MAVMVAVLAIIRIVIHQEGKKEEVQEGEAHEKILRFSIWSHNLLRDKNKCP
jgi:hypothetical protein